MDIKKIQELVRIVTKSGIGEIRIEEKDFKITIKQKGEAVQVIPSQQIPQQAAQQQLPSSQTSKTEEKKEEAKPKEDNLVPIKSPMIGTFYRQAGPGKPVFASIGDEIQVGQVVCIIEAMKLFNEIESEVAGRIAKVLVEDASPVEFDQPLFLVEPL